MTSQEKIIYYLNKLNGGISDENVSEFLYDISECRYHGDMFCPLCSAGCFKIAVLQKLSKKDFEKINDMMFKIRYMDKKSEM